MAPSIRHKLDSHKKIIRKLMRLLPITKIYVETANFDIQALKNPDISGEEYQKGEMCDFRNLAVSTLSTETATLARSVVKMLSKMVQCFACIISDIGKTIIQIRLQIH